MQGKEPRRARRHRRATLLVASAVLGPGLAGAARPALAQVRPVPELAAQRSGQEAMAGRVMSLLEAAEQRTIAGHMTAPIDASAAALLLDLAVLMPNSSVDGRLAVSAFLTRLNQDAAQAAAGGDREQAMNLTVLRQMVASSLDMPGLAETQVPELTPALPAPTVVANAGAGTVAAWPWSFGAVPDRASVPPSPPTFAGSDVPRVPNQAALPDPPVADAAPGWLNQDAPVTLADPGVAVVEPGPRPAASEQGSEPEHLGTAPAPASTVAQAPVPGAVPDASAVGRGTEPRTLADLRGPDWPAPYDAAPRGGRGNDAAAMASLPRTEMRPSAAAGPDVPAALPGRPELAQALVAVLVKRGEEMVALGDISAARRLFERAAMAGDAAAALAAGKMYDPNILVGIHVRGIQPDPEMARRWYDRAAALGGTAPATKRQAPAAPVAPALASAALAPTALAGNDDKAQASGTGSPGMGVRPKVGVRRWAHD